MKRLIIILSLLTTFASVNAQVFYFDRRPSNPHYVIRLPMSDRVRNCLELAVAGAPEEQYRLASFYHEGYGLEQNDSLAFYWAKESAMQDYPAGLYFIAYAYETGKGVAQDTEKAISLYKRALEEALPLAEQGDATAQFVMGKLYDYGNGGIEINQQSAVRWYRKSAMQGYAGAQFNLGNCYQLGEGVKEDKTQAVYWYSKAADQGDPEAQYMLGLCYASGEGVKKNTHKAIKWFKESAKQGNRHSQHILQRIGVDRSDY